ncbi:MAG: M13 family metallopeptidase [Dongiaceae bacterium]
MPERIAGTIRPKMALLLLLAALSPSAAGAQQAKPAIGAWGFDLAGMDKSARPGDEFYDYANGQWDRTVVIPANRLSVGGFPGLADQAAEQLHAILEEAAADGQAAAGSERRQIGDFYAALMDQATIGKLGLAPLKPGLDRIAAVQSVQDLSRLLGADNNGFGARPLKVAPAIDRADPSRMVLEISAGGLSLDVRDFYLEEGFAAVRAQHRQHIARLLALAGIPDSEARAERIQALETKIAAAHWPSTDLRDVEKTDNRMPTAELAARFPGVDWAVFLEAAGCAGQAEVNVESPSAIAGIARLVAGEPLPAWRDYLTYALLKDTATFLPQAFEDERFAFYDKVLRGQQEPPARWEQAVGATGLVLRDAVARIYVARHFPPQARADIDALVDNLLAAFDARLARLDWMAPSTRAAARQKIARLTRKIGYPDTWKDYAGLVVERGDALGNVQRGIAFLRARELQKLGKPVDRTEWGRAPFEVNAYANPQWNEIVFLAAILQPPFFDPAADDAVNYGAIGAVIGHEISHLFDDQGQKFDAEGRMANWWTPEDAARFKAASENLVAQYSAYEVLPGQHVNGQLTLGENIADLAGVLVAYDAYHRSLGGKPAPVIDGLTGDQRFFLGFAQAWREKVREAAMVQLLRIDVHSPSKVRPDVVRNVDAWYAAFDVKPGDKLYLPPEQRIRMW